MLLELIKRKNNKPTLTEPRFKYTIKEILEAMVEIRKRPWNKKK